MTAILQKSGFWLTLLVLNLLFLEVQPVVAALSAAVVIMLYIVGTIVEKSRGFRLSPRAKSVLLVIFLWLATGGLLAYYFDKKDWAARNEDGLLLVAAINLAAWLVPFLAYRTLRMRAERTQTAAEDDRHRTTSHQRDRAQKRRDDARASCEIFFGLHAPEIGARFSREMFDDFVSRHMGDDRAPEYVEQRARQLRDTLQKHLDKIEPPEDTRTIEDLARWYQDMHDKIRKQPIEEKYRNAQLVHLKVRYQTLVQELLEDLKP